MKAIAGITPKHMALLDEYRMALSLWTETRALYVPGAVEIAQATKHLENLEHELVLCDVPTFAPKLLPAVDAESSAARPADEP